MKKLFVSLILVASAMPAFAQHYGRHHNHNHFRGGPSWGYIVAPLVIGGIAGAAIANSRQPETVIIQQSTPLPVIVNQNCTPWTETYHSDGTITRTRTCAN